MSSQALVPAILRKPVLQSTALFVVSEFAFVALGVVILSLLAQVTVPLPWTPVPITGQTFGVAVVALSWGSRRALAVISVYLLIGSLGAPVFALGKSGFLIGPTLGYLIGMWIATFAMGLLADRGFTKTFTGSLVSAYIGSAITLSTGVFALSYFVEGPALLMAGLWPFLPGDLVKNLLAACISCGLKRGVRDGKC